MTATLRRFVRLLPIALVLVVLALALAACSTTSPPQPPTVVTIAPPPPTWPAECRTAGDPTWTSPPAADVRRRQAVALWNRNRAAFDALAGRRRVCEAGLRAHDITPRRTASATAGGH